MAKRTSAARLALCLCLGMTAGNPASVAGAGDTEDKKESSSKTSKPRVFTNADLEKYSKAGKGRKVVQTPPARVLPLEEEVAPAPPSRGLPVEDLLEATLPELEERQRELQELATYLRAKEAWFKNPFLRRPTPTAGETLLDPSISGAQQLQVTRSRIFAVEIRLGRIRALLQSGGSPTPAPQP